jgi:hypothetical protein
MSVPTFEEWLSLSEIERERQMDRPSGYDGEGEALVQRMPSTFEPRSAICRGSALAGQEFNLAVAGR